MFGIRMARVSGRVDSSPARRPSPARRSMAPAPSPKRTQVERSVQSSSLLIASAETTSTALALPQEMKASAISMQ